MPTWRMRERDLASDLQSLSATDLEPGIVNEYASNNSSCGDSSQEMSGAIQNNYEHNIRHHNEIVAVTKYVRWVNWMRSCAPALLLH